MSHTEPALKFPAHISPRSREEEGNSCSSKTLPVQTRGWERSRWSHWRQFIVTIVTAQHRGHSPLPRRPTQAVGAGISRGSCGQPAPNFPVGSLNGLSTVAIHGRNCINPFSTSPAPSPHPPGPGLASAQQPWGGAGSLLLPGRSSGRKAEQRDCSTPSPSLSRGHANPREQGFPQAAAVEAALPGQIPSSPSWECPALPPWMQMSQGHVKERACGWHRAGGAPKEKRCPETLPPARHW